MGKYYPFPHSQSDTKSFAVSFANCVRHALPFAVADIRISRFQPRSKGVGWFDGHAREFTQGISKSSQQTETVNVLSCSGAL